MENLWLAAESRDADALSPYKELKNLVLRKFGEQDHHTDGTPCPCKPTIAYNGPEGNVLVHNLYAFVDPLTCSQNE